MNGWRSFVVVCFEPKGLSHGTISMLQSTIAGPRAPADAFSQKTPKSSGDQPFAVHANGTYASARPPDPSSSLSTAPIVANHQKAAFTSLMTCGASCCRWRLH